MSKQSIALMKNAEFKKNPPKVLEFKKLGNFKQRLSGVYIEE